MRFGIGGASTCSRGMIGRASLLGGTSALALTLLTGTALALPVNYGGLTWNTDRYAPDTVAVLPMQYGRSNVLHIAFGPNGDAANRGGLNGSFWQYQGIQAPTNLPGGTEAFYQIDMWIPTGWATNIPGGSLQDGAAPNNYLATIIANRTHVDASLWAEIPANAPPGLGAYPTWGFLNDELYSGTSTPDVMIFDTENGTIINPGPGPVSYGTWNTLRMEYRDTQMLFFINGVLAHTQTWTDADIPLAGDPNNTIKTLFLNQFHYETPGPGGENYNSYSALMFDYWNFFYSNLNYGVITDDLENLNVVLNTNADIEVRNGANLTVGGGSGTSGAEGNLIVFNGGQIKGGAAGNPYLISGTAVVNAGGLFSGWANVAGTVTNLGTISPGNSPGIMNFGGYVSGGTILTEVQFNNAAAPVNGTTHDFVNITGNVTGGTTLLNVVPFAPSGSPVATTGNGIELVRVGGTVSAGNFALSAPVLQGGFEYLLAYVPNYSGALDGFFLQSASRQEIAMNAGLLSAGQNTMRSCAQRPGGMADLSKSGHVWAGGQIGEFRANAASGVTFEADSDCVGGGVSHTVSSDLQVGIGGGFGATDVVFTLPQGTARADGDMSVLKANASYVSGVFFANAGLGYGSMEWDITKAAAAGIANATMDGIIGDVEAGVRTSLGTGSALTLGLGLLYDGMACGSNCFIVGSNEDADEWSGRVSGRLDFTIGNGRLMPFIAANYLASFGDGNKATMGNAVSVSDTASGLFEGEAGFNLLINQNVSITALGSFTEGQDSAGDGFKLGAGARFSW